MKIGLGVRRAKIMYALSQFFFYFNFFWLIQNIYFTEKGLNYSQLAIILSAWSVSVVVFEIPSGLLADKLSRKGVIIFGKICFLLGMLLFVLKPDFYGFLFGVILLGMHEAFISGAEEALYFDYLKLHHQEERFKEVLSYANILREVGLGTSVLIAGFLAKYGTQYNLAGSLISAFMGVLISFFIPNVQSKESGYLNFLSIFKSATSKMIRIPHLRVILFFTICVLINYMVVSEYFVLSLKQVGYSYELIGVIALVEMMFFILGTHLVEKFEENMKVRFYTWLSVLMGLGMLLVHVGTQFTVLVGFLFMRSLKALSEIYSSTDWQKHSESHDRATLASIRSLIGNIIYVPLAFLFGVAADAKGLFAGFYVTAIVAFSFLIIKLLKLKSN